MGLRTSNGTGGGDWNQAATWDTGVPVNNDTFLIKNGDIVVMNDDQSGFADGMGASTIEDGGTLICETAAGSYYLKMNGDLAITGTLQAGISVAVPLPSDVMFTNEMNGARSLKPNDATGNLKLYCTQPTNAYARLSGAEAAGQTVLSVDTDLTADEWADGDTVWIVDVSGGTKDVEERVIAAGGIAATTLTITVALTNAKVENAFIFLQNRNIRIINSTTWAIEEGSNGIVEVYAEISNCNRGFRYTENGIFDGFMEASLGGFTDTLGFQMSGTVIVAVLSGFSSCSGTIMDGIIAGSATGMANCAGGAMTGIITGCNTGLYFSGGDQITGTFDGNRIAVDRGAACVFGNATFVRNGTADLQSVASGIAFNTIFGGGTEFASYDSPAREKWSYFSSEDHDQVINAYKAWCRGGIVTSQTASPPTGYTIWYEHAAEYIATGSFPCFRQFETVVQPGTAIEVEGYIRIADGEDLGTDPPALQIIDKFADPLVDSTQSPLDEDEIPEPDGGVEAGWQFVSVIWANAGDSPRTVIVRMYASVANVGAAVDVDEVWNIADYQDQIQSIYNNVGTAVALDGGLATLAGMLTKMADDNDGADFNAGRESLREIRTRGDLAWATGVGATPTAVYTIDTIVRTVGDNDGGTDADVDIVDGVYFSTGEVNVGTFLEVDAAFTAGIGENPVSVDIWGFYNGGGGHYMRVQAYNYIDSVFEDIGTIGNSSIVSLHSFAMNPQHINTSTGAIAIKILHSTIGVGIVSHVLSIDKIIVSTASVSLLETNVETILDAVRPLGTAVAVSDTALSFTLTAGEPTAGAYEDMVLAIQDADDDHWEERMVKIWTSGRVVTVDKEYSFTPDVGDVAWLKGCAYVDMEATLDAINTPVVEENEVPAVGVTPDTGDPLPGGGAGSSPGGGAEGGGGSVESGGSSGC